MKRSIDVEFPGAPLPDMGRSSDVERWRGEGPRTTSIDRCWVRPSGGFGGREGWEGWA
jgi:hypothetical protein